MLRNRLAAVLAVGALALPAHQLSGQQAQDPPLRDTDPPTFRTGTELVTVDAVVVDRDGRHVTDLGPADFEVMLAGKRQRVRQAVYVPAGTATLGSTAIAGVTAAPGVRRLGPSPLAPRREATGRVMAIVVDDLGLSFESTAYVRRMLTKVVDEQLQPNDLVAILRTGAGVGALQQFTTDKRLLHAAIDRVRWTVLSRSGIGAFAPISPPNALGAPIDPGSGTAENDNEDDPDGLRTNMSAVGSLAALEYVVRGIDSLPGRKSVLLVSEGFRLFARPTGFKMAGGSRVWNAFTRLMDQANRAGVVVYAIDARGLQTTGPTAQDNPQADWAGHGLSSASQNAQTQERVTGAARSNYLRDSQESLHYIAEQTGGFAFVNNNDLNLGFRRVFDDLAGYYLLGFDRPLDDPREWDPGRLKVDVTREGLRVRSRKGLFGPADPRRTPEPAPVDPLVMAALSPFAGGEIDVRLTTLFGHDVGQGSYMRSLFFVDPAGVSFVKNDTGQHEATLSLVLLTIGDNGATVSQHRRPVTLRLEEEPYRVMRQRGILYSARLPIKDAGGYQVRAAVRDERTGRIGSASQFFEVPRVGKGRVTMSGVVMQGLAATDANHGELPAGADVALDEAVLFEPGVRIFSPGSDAVYSAEIYDGVPPRGDRTLVTSTALLRDGQVVYESPASPMSTRTGKDGVRVVPVAGRVTLGRRTPPGVYTLRVTVSEQRAGQAVRSASQWVDFEVRR